MIFGIYGDVVSISKIEKNINCPNIYTSENVSIYNCLKNCISENDFNIVFVFGDIYNEPKNISNSILYLLETNKQISEYVSKLNGEFIVIIIYKKDEKIEIYRDQFGFIPLYYSNYKNNLIFSTQIKTLFKYFDEKPEIDYRWFYSGLIGNKLDKGITQYKNIKLLPDSTKLIYKKGEISLQKYWQLDIKIKAKLYSQQEYIKNFKTLLINSVSSRIENESIISTELSGGIDSSSVTSIANTNENIKKIYSFSHSIETESEGKIFPYYDETYFSKLVASSLNKVEQILLENKEIGLYDLLEVNIKTLCYSSSANYMDYLFPIIEQSKSKSKIILSGFGGDQVVSYQGLSYVKERLKRFQFKNTKKYINQIKTYYNYSTFRAIIGIYANLYFQPIVNILKKNAKEKLLIFYNRKYINDNKNGIKWTLYQRKREDFKNLNQIIYNLFNNQNTFERITSCSELAIANGISYKFPLLDKDLVEYYFSIPSENKSSPDYTRYIFREAMKGILLEEVRLRNDKSGSTIPSVQTLFLRDFDKIEKFITQCKSELSNNVINYDELLKWHKFFKNRTNNESEIKFKNYIIVLKQLIFLFLYENDKL